MKKNRTKRGGAFALVEIITLIFAFAFTALAGTVTPNSGTTFPGGNTTTNVLAAATNAPLTVWTFADSSENSLQWSFNCSSANSTEVILRFDTSNNGSTWITNALSVAQTPAGAVMVVGGTNLPGTVPQWRLRLIENPGGGAITNLTITAFKKNGI